MNFGLHRFLFVAVMILSAMNLSAQQSGKYWDTDVIKNTSTYSIEKTAGSGDSTIYHVKSENDMAYVAWLMNRGDAAFTRDLGNGVVISIEADLDLGEYYWRALGEGDGNGNYWKSFTASVNGNGHTIRNLCAHGGNGDGNCGFIDIGGSNMVVRNLTFENCFTSIGENNGIIVGSLQNASNVTIDHITFKGCRCWGDSGNGMIAGWAYKCTNLKVSNITIAGIYTGTHVLSNHSENLQGENYNGGLIGQIEACTDYVIDNVKVTNTTAWGNDELGGIVGENHTSNGTIKNCLVNVTYSGNRDNSGGIIGKIWGGSVTISNCVAYIEKMFDGSQPSYCIGGIVGHVVNSGMVELFDDAVIGANMTKTNTLYQGCLVGANCNQNKTPGGSIYISRCYIDKSFGTTNEEIQNASFGSDVMGSFSSKVHWSDIHPYTSTTTDAVMVSRAALMNKAGACYGIPESYMQGSDCADYTIYPLVSDTLGKVIGYTYSSPKVTLANGTGVLENLALDTSNGMVSMAKNRPTTYTFQTEDDKWIVKDNSTGLASTERTGGWTFKAYPNEAGVLDVTLAKRPTITIRKAEYNDVRKTVKLSWTIDDYDKDNWPDAKFVIRRLYDGEYICDTVSIDSTTWTDNRVDIVTTSTNERNYSIYFICPSQKYNIPDSTPYAKSTSVTVQSGYTISLDEPVSSKSNLTIKAKLPNAMLLDGWNLKLLRWNTQQEDSLVSVGAVPASSSSSSVMSYILSHWQDFMIDKRTYNAESGSSEDYLYQNFTDNVPLSSCYMTRYMLLCDNPDGSDAAYHSKSVNYISRNSVTFRSFTASKGESTSKVKLTCDATTSTTEEMLYVFSKKKYLANDTTENDESQWLQIYSVKGTSGIITYTDETYSGYVYKYRVRAYPACESSYSTAVYDNEATDIGFATNRGTIMGTISYDSGKTSVQGVDVRLTSDASSLEDATPAYSMAFNGEDDCLPLAPGMGENFWKGNWTLQWMMRPEDNPQKEYTSLLSLPGRFAIQMKGDTLCMAEKQMPVNNRSWNNHIMLSHSDNTYRLGYTSNPGTSTDDYVHWVASVTDSEMATFMSSLNETTNVDTLYFGIHQGQQSTSFLGEIDEVRLWNAILTDEELENTYDRYLTGAETNIRAYYTFDAGVGEYAFDSSHPSGVWSSRHTKLPNVGSPYISSVIPDIENLTYRGITDKNGTYQISGIPFVGEGTNYQVVPVFGTHSFLPSSIRRFISSQSLTQSDVDFTDESSFNVKVQAYYALGNYPASGLTILVDNAVATVDGENVTTDEDGFAEVQVPIGQHRIALEGSSGHTMVNNGYACTVTGANADGTFSYTAYNPTGTAGYIDVQSDFTAPLTFYDGTFVRLAGKVTGGNAEEEQPIGFQLTHANLGTAQITLEPSKNADKYSLYNYGADGSKFVLSNSLPSDTLTNGNINSTTTYTKGSSVVTIDVDPETGEYLAMLPPVTMTIKHVKTTGALSEAADASSDVRQLVDDDFSMSKLPPEVSFDLSTLYADTLYTGESLSEYEVFKYHAKKSYIYHVDPLFNMYNPATKLSKDSLMYGEEYFTDVYTDDDDKEVTDSVSLWSKTLRDGSSDAYLIKTTASDGTKTGHPVFYKGNLYSFYMSIYEKYTNRTTGKDTLYYQDNVEITVHNNMAIQSYTDLSTGYAIDTTTVDDTTMDIPEDGIVKYNWTAGQPNPAGDHTLEMNISYTANGTTYSAAHISGIVMGSVPIPGTDFVTAGPNNVAFVLRDPPGSASYSWIEKGSTITHDYSEQQAIVTTQQTSTQFKTRDVTTTYTGVMSPSVTLTLSNTHDNYTDNSGGLTLSYSHLWDSGSSLSFTTTDKVETSGSDPYIGANGDVYIGTSRNMTFAKCNTIGFAQQDSQVDGSIESNHGRYYSLSQGESIAKSDSFTTMFTYSQMHIVNELIPQLKKMRHSRVNLWVDDPSTYQPNPSDLKGDAVYYVAKNSIKNTDPTKEKDVWTADIDYKAFVPSDGNGYTINSSDTIQLYSTWIQGWYEAIKENEKTKYETQTKYSSMQEYEMADGVTGYYGFMGNESLDAGSASTKSITRTYTTTDADTNTESEQQTVILEHNFESILWFIGVANKTTYTGTVSHNGTYKTTTTKAETQTFGYYMHDDKYGNVLSVDTYLPGKLTGTGSFKDLNSAANTAKFDEFYVFRVRGGQTKCPYQAAETALQYHIDNNSANALASLGDGTVAIESPKIEVVTRDINNVDAGQSAFTQIKISNTSSATVTVPCTFDLTVDQSTSADGLALLVDGNTLNGTNANQFQLMPGESMTKTLQIQQSDESILDYNNIVLRLVSDCDISRYAVDSLSVHFKAASSPVTLAQEERYVNTVNSNDSSMTFRISGYDVTRKGFAGIRLKYKKQDDVAFSTYKILIADSTLYANNVEKFQWDDTHAKLDMSATSPVTVVKVKMADMDDGAYHFVAESFTPYSQTDEATTQSDTMYVVKDTQRPAKLTTPSPATGYYTIGSEISLQMNEDIQMENVSEANNIEVTSVLNDAEVTHSSGLHFDGCTPARTASRVQILSDNAALAFWYKPQVGKTSCLLSQTFKGTSNEDIPLKIMYNADATMSVWINDTEFRSQRHAYLSGTTTPIDDWMYCIYQYQHPEGGTGTMSLYNLFGTSTETESTFVLQENLKYGSAKSNVPLYVGGSEHGDSCYADMEGLVVYEDVQTFETMAADKENKHTGNTCGLLAYWPMDEGSGLTAHDLVRSRDLTLQGTDNWYLPVTNYALNLSDSQSQTNPKYMVIKTDKCPIGKNEDYSLELWFRSLNPDMADGEMMTLISKQGTQSTERASMSLGSNGQIVLSVAGQTREMGKGYNDGQWHHLALNVQRESYLTLMVDTIDISSTAAILGSKIGAFSTSQIAIGVQKYNDGEQEIVQNNFIGEIDEVRLWRAYRTNASIKQNAYTRLKGNETGLVAYYPFEKTTVVSEQSYTQPYLGDRVETDSETGTYPADTSYVYGFDESLSGQELANAVTDDNGPQLRAANILTPIDIDFTTNGKDKIVFTFPDNFPKNRIEGCVVNFRVKNLYDVAGNPMKQPIEWSVYVKQNPLKWDCSAPSMTQEIGSQATAVLSIYNNSSETQTWNISGVPTWAKLSSTTGIINPFDYATVTLTTVEGTSTGYYQGVLNLVGNDEIYSPLGISLSVTNIKPDWEVEPTTGANWMAIFGRLKIADNWTDDEDDIVGMFDDEDRCLALASPTYYQEQDASFITLNVKGNSDDAGKKLHFRVWDASTGIIYENAGVEYYIGNDLYKDTCQIFNNCAVLGTFSKPYVINTGNTICQTFNLHQGWNWISLWVTPKAGSTCDKVFGSLSDKITEIKSRTGGYLASDMDQLTMSPENSYRIFATEEATVSVEGEKVDPSSVPMNFNGVEESGDIYFQWIGFPLWQTMTLSTAFADFQPVTDDIIKSEDGYAMYNGNAWIGNLKYLSPGMGYVYGYHGEENIAWTYPSLARSESASGGFTLGVNKYKYENYTFVEVTIVDSNGQPISGYDYQLGAFINGNEGDDSKAVCCGVADGISGQSCPISIFGKQGDTYTFKLYNKANGQVYDLEGTKEYDDFTSPQTLTLTISTTTGIGNVNADTEVHSVRYNPSGMRIGNNIGQHGVNIIKYSNGTTEKIIIK